VKSICVFCGSSAGNNRAYVEAAEQLGRAIARRGATLVFGGGRVGLMGALADAALAERGTVVGVMPHSLVEREIAHPELTTLHAVESMHERKQRMAELADAFVLMPGGFGSWEEFCEIVTWAQLGLHQKPFAVLNVMNYYAPLIAMADHAASEGFIRPIDRSALIVESEPEQLLAQLSARPATGLTAKWANAKTPP
jgi:uncharacterized protein (TIGR00730 family)